MAIDREIRKRGGRPNREARQQIGLEIHETKGQRWLCERVLAAAGNARLIVVDGLRFLEDRAFFLEHFGSRFLHLHIVTPRELRKKRCRARTGPTFDEADGQLVESEIDRLGTMAAVTVDNSTSIATLSNAVQQAVDGFLERAVGECRFQSS